MKTIKHAPDVKNDDDVMLGDGMLLLGENGETYENASWDKLGAMRGTAIFRPVIENNVLSIGTPAVDIMNKITSIKCEIEVTLVEVTPSILLKAFGLGTVSTTAAVTGKTESETVYLYGDYFHYLVGNGITLTSVMSTDATPVEYDTDDYEVDATNGAIRRKTTGSITAGEKVTVNYTWNSPEYSVLSIGNQISSNIYPARFIVPKDNGYDMEFRMWKASPMNVGELNFQNNEYTDVTLSFMGLYDRTRLPEQAYYQILMGQATSS